jgi:hypothetical protein
MADRIYFLRLLVTQAKRESRARIQVVREILDGSHEAIVSTCALIEETKQRIEQSKARLAEQCPHKSGFEPFREVDDN